MGVALVTAPDIIRQRKQGQIRSGCCANHSVWFTYLSVYVNHSNAHWILPKSNVFWTVSEI